MFGFEQGNECWLLLFLFFFVVLVGASAAVVRAAVMGVIGKTWLCGLAELFCQHKSFSAAHEFVNPKI